MDIEKIQSALKERNLNGWLLCDFHNRDLISYRITGIGPHKFTSRRWFYFIPADGEPVKLVSKVENTKLDNLPGEKILYLSWSELHEKLTLILKGKGKVAMQYSPMNNIPYVSIIDAGLMEVIRQSEIEVVSSADLITIFEATISPEGYRKHKKAAAHLYQIVRECFKKIAKSAKGGGKENEYTIQQFILKEFKKRGLHWDDPPIVGVNEHPADPHFETAKERALKFKQGDAVLIDLWARMDDEKGIFADITWCAYIGKNPPSEYLKAFETIVEARDAGVNFIKEKMSAGEKVYGYEVDDVVRGVVSRKGFGDYFIHRTGHSIGFVVHGNGPNIDNLETKDERELLPGVCFSIEPGIYIEGKFGVRTEINVFIHNDRTVEVTTKPQQKLLLL